NPRSGESVHIPEKRVPHFKPGKGLREAVDARTQELVAKGLLGEAKTRKRSQEA
ncbi:MAG: HU family DNA-binding protein, partial [Burkholderiaceae bacterium]|nr:HU family DNA-binding protein [Burkholderiaceae bacterium]